MTAPKEPKPDLAWAKEKIKGFAELKQVVDAMKADTARYKAGDTSHRGH
jgi:hypothetical protein